MRRLMLGGPWARVALWWGRRLYRAYSALGPAERRRLRQLLVKSRGRLRNLSSADRAELRIILATARGRRARRRLLRRR